MANKDAMFFVLFDKNGHELAKFPWSARLNQSSVSEGLIRFGQMLQPSGYLDTHGRIVIKPDIYSNAGNFRNGLAVAQKNHELGWIDRNGQMVIGPIKDAAVANFGKSRGIVTFQNKGRPLSGAVDRQGNFTIPPEYEVLIDVGDDKFLAGKAGQLQLIDPNNSVICRFPSDCSMLKHNWSFSAGSIVPCALGGDVGTGELQSKPRTGAKWGYCDLHGNTVIPAKFDHAGFFENGVAVAAAKGPDQKIGTGLIDQQGEWSLPPIYKSVQIAGPNRLIVGIEGSEPDRFNKGEWKKFSSNRYDSFAHLLAGHNLIGMSRKELIELLGEGDMKDANDQLIPLQVKHHLIYTLRSGLCGNAWGGVDFGIDGNDKVWGWRPAGFMSYGHWFTEDVVLVDAMLGAQSGNVLPKVQKASEVTGQ